MSKTFEQMNKTELVAAVAFLKLDEEVAKEAKNPEKVTNLEYVAVLERYKKAQDSVNKEQADKIEKVKSDPAAEKSTEFDAPASNETARQTKSDDLFTVIPVIVTDHDTNTVIEDDSELRMVSFTWGNPIIGMYTVQMPLHGRLQYLPKGAVIRLKRIALATATNDAEGKPVAHKDLKRFSVADTTGWTKEQFDAHKEEQKLKSL